MIEANDNIACWTGSDGRVYPLYPLLSGCLALATRPHCAVVVYMHQDYNIQWWNDMHIAPLRVKKNDRLFTGSKNTASDGYC